MNHFYKDDIILRLGSRSRMIDYLSNHFRYFTMNSWNRSTSYANNVKIYNLPIPNSDTAYELIQSDWFYHEASFIMDQFAVDNAYEYQAGFSGRSGGYIVMYNGELRDTGYKSRCDKCGQLNFKTVEETGNNSCGKCGRLSRVNLTEPLMRPTTYPGRGIDADEDFEEWSSDSLRDRVHLVCKFDKMCDRILDFLVSCCEKGVVEMEETP